MYSANANKEVEILLQKCVSLYMATINYNSSLDDEKIYIALTGGFVTSMEASFMWIGGWRPTTALLLVYSLMGVQLEDEIRNFGYGIRDTTNTSAVLSHRQLENLTNVQKSTRNVEKKLSKKLAHLQMLISDQDVLAAVMQVDSSTSRSGSKANPDIRTVLKPRMSRLKKLLIQADQLRLHTLHQLFLVLTPVQVARCAIASFELAFMMRELGNSAHCRNLQTAVPSSSNTFTSQSQGDFDVQSSRTLPSRLDTGPSCSTKDSGTSVEECSVDD